MTTKRSTHLDDPPSASSDDDETEDEQEPQTISQKPIQQSSSSEEEEEEEDDEEESDSESEEETPEPVKPPLEKPQIQNPSSKPAESSSEEESESESEEETQVQTPAPVKTSIEKQKTPTPNSSSVFDFESDIRSPTASDFAIKPSKKTNVSETPESKPTLKRHSLASDPKDNKKKMKVLNGDIDDDKKSVSKRVWSDDDELQLLQGFIDYQLEKGYSPLSDMDGFYQFTMDLVPGNASKSQLYEKIRRLKKKFRVNSDKVSADGEDPVFVKPHEHKLFEISKKIWGIDGCETLSNAGGSNSAKAKIRHSKIKPKMEVKEEVVEDDVEMEKAEGFETLYPYWNAGLNSEVSTSLKFPAGVVTLVKEHLSLIGEEKAKEMNEKWEALFDDEAVLRKRRIALLSNIGK